MLFNRTNFDGVQGLCMMTVLICNRQGYQWRHWRPDSWGQSCGPDSSSAAVWEVPWNEPTASLSWPLWMLLAESLFYLQAWREQKHRVNILVNQFHLLLFYICSKHQTTNQIHSNINWKTYIWDLQTTGLWINQTGTWSSQVQTLLKIKEPLLYLSVRHFVWVKVSSGLDSADPKGSEVRAQRQFISYPTWGVI